MNPFFEAYQFGVKNIVSPEAHSKLLCEVGKLALSDDSCSDRGCFHKRLLVNKKVGTRFLARCHKCESCHSIKYWHWVGRLQCEQKDHQVSSVLTLTYSDSHLWSNDISQLYSDVQKFFKILRKAGYKFRYFVAGEYGGKLGRPHFHVILFGIGAERRYHRLPDQHFIKRSWHRGHVLHDQLTGRGVGYVAKYVQKKQSTHSIYRMSQSLGLPYIKQVLKRFVKRYPSAVLNYSKFRIGKISFPLYGSFSQNFRKYLLEIGGLFSELSPFALEIQSVRDFTRGYQFRKCLIPNVQT